MRIKNLLLIIVAFVLLISASAQAEYEQYRLTEPSEKYAGAYVTVYPLDPHNVIVRMAPPEEAPWRVDWYRDGQLIRSLSATGDYDRVSPASPVIERDGSFSMLCRIPGKGQETEKFPQLNATAQWTDEGLTNISPLKEQLKAARCGNRIAFYETDQYVRISYNRKDMLVSRALADSFKIKTTRTSCIALADEVFLIPTREDGLICLDHGNIRYKLDDSFLGNEMLADGQEGFFSCYWDYVEWTSDRDYSPVRLVHFDRNGQNDRTYQLFGDRVVITPYQTFINTQNDTITLYGSAVDSSRGIIAVFAMTLDKGMNVAGLDVWDIDSEYNGCEASVCLSPGGFPYAYLFNRNHPESIQPAVVPISMLERSSEDYGITLK